MTGSTADRLAALLGIGPALLEQTVPGIGAILEEPEMAGLAALVAGAVRREAVLDPADDALRAQILRYHATDLMTDRERAAFLGLPEGCRMRERAKILAPEKLSLGRNVWIGEGAVLDAQGGLIIGDNSQIGLGVMIWSHSSHLQAVRGETTVSRDSIVYKPTSVGANCFIGGPSIVTAGVTIGDGAMIMPLTFVDRDVAPGERVSAPRSLKKLEDRVAKLEKALAALASAP